MAYASRLYPRAKPRGFTLQWIKIRGFDNQIPRSMFCLAIAN